MARDPTTRIQALEKHLSRTAESFNPNPLLELIHFARHDDPKVVHSAIWALHRVFIKIIGDGRVGRATLVSSTQVTEDGEVDVGGEGWQVREWIMKRLGEYVDVLAGLMRDSEEALRASSVPLLFSLLPSLSLAASPPPGPSVIHIPYIRLLIRHTLFPTPSLRGSKEVKGALRPDEENQVDLDEGVLPEDVATALQEGFWAQYDDLRWAFFREASTVIQDEGRPVPHAGNIMNQLVPLTNLPKIQDDLNTFYVPALAAFPKSSNEPSSSKKVKGGKATKSKKGKGKETELDATPDWMAFYESGSEGEEDEGAGPVKTGTKRRTRASQLSIHASVHSIQSHQTVYSMCWETVFGRVQLDDHWIRRVLVGLHGEKGILGNMKAERRVRLTDWLGSLIDGGGANAMLAMNGLYVLMTQYNLDYPNFYQKLYALLDRHVMHVKYRARFFRLLDTFLASPLLPAAMIASFIKRLSRLALVSPPAGIIMLIPFIYNLFKRHPGCMVMIQRISDEDTSTYQDPYNGDDRSPFTSNAIKSSCWELATLQTHYLSSVSIMAKIFTEVFTKPEFNMEDFMDHGYGTLFETEIKRKIKYAPALSFALESGKVGDLFPSMDTPVEAREAGDVVSELWSF